MFSYGVFNEVRDQYKIINTTGYKEVGAVLRGEAK